MQQEEFEKEAMEMMLAGDGPYLDLLRKQYQHSTIKGRDMTGVGFYTGFDIDARYVSENKNLRGRMEGLIASYSNPKSGDGVMMLILWINDGQITTLEGIQMDGDMPEKEFCNVKFEYGRREAMQARCLLRTDPE